MHFPLFLQLEYTTICVRLGSPTYYDFELHLKQLHEDVHWNVLVLAIVRLDCLTEWDF